MSELVHARVDERLVKLRLGAVARALDGILSQAARAEPTYLDFLDQLLAEETEAKQRKRVAMGIQIAHFPTVKTLEDFDFKFQPSVDQKLVTRARHRTLRRRRRERPALRAARRRQDPPRDRARPRRRRGRPLGPLRHRDVAARRALAKAQSEGKLADQLAFYAKPKLFVIDELGYLPFEKQTAHLFFQLVTRRYERGSMLITTNQIVTQWGHVFGDEMIAAAVLDRLLHHSHTLVIQGDSYRLKQKKRAGFLGSSKT